MVEAFRPFRGGYIHAFGATWFITEFLKGTGPMDTPRIDASKGAPQADIFHHYKMALIRVTALDRATRAEEKKAKWEKRSIDPTNIEKLAERYQAHMPYKANGCRYHSFVVYFSNLQRLNWVEPSGKVEPSAFQSNYPSGQPRKYFRLTAAGKAASDSAWANPLSALYR